SAASARCVRAGPRSGGELSSICPPGSKVTLLPAGGGPTSSSRVERWSTPTGSAGRVGSATSHSASTPTLPGGPVLKQIPLMYSWMSSVFMCTIGCSHRDAGDRWHLQDPCPHPPPPERELSGNRTRCWTGRPPCRVIGATRPATPLLTAGPDIDTPPSSEEGHTCV